MVRLYGSDYDYNQVASRPQVTFDKEHFDAFTDALNNYLDRLMNYCAGGLVLGAAREEVKAARTLIRTFRGEDDV